MAEQVGVAVQQQEALEEVEEEGHHQVQRRVPEEVVEVRPGGRVLEEVFPNVAEGRLGRQLLQHQCVLQEVFPCPKSMSQVRERLEEKEEEEVLNRDVV